VIIIMIAYFRRKKQIQLWHSGAAGTEFVAVYYYCYCIRFSCVLPRDFVTRVKQEHTVSSNRNTNVQTIQPRRLNLGIFQTAFASTVITKSATIQASVPDVSRDSFVLKKSHMHVRRIQSHTWVVLHPATVCVSRDIR
jgi:hypothetical protein